jgi:hypothetical protein
MFAAGLILFILPDLSLHRLTMKSPQKREVEGTDKVGMTSKARVYIFAGYFDFLHLYNRRPCVVRLTMSQNDGRKYGCLYWV